MASSDQLASHARGREREHEAVKLVLSPDWTLADDRSLRRLDSRMQRGRTQEGHLVSHRHRIVIISCVVLLSACASSPTAQLGKTEAAYRAAEEAGSAKQPSSAYHLKLAQEGIANAKAKMDGGRRDKHDARDLLERAELDAEVAIARAHTADARARAKRAWIEVKELKSDGAPTRADE